MKLKYLALFCCSFFTSTSLLAGIMREDIPVQDYRDFAENLGKYSVGKENIEVFKKDGSSAGVLAFPIPDFGAIVSGGYATLNAPSYLVSVKHNTGYQSVDFGNKAKYKTTYTLINRNEHSDKDFHMPRLNKVVTEAAPVASVDAKELPANPGRYTFYARAGAGTQKQVNTDTQQLATLASAYQWKSGGVFTAPTFESWRLRWYNYSPDNPKAAIFDSAGQGGDSGSPVFVYDNVEKIWKLVGVTTSIAGTAPYNMRTYNLFMQDAFVAQTLAANTDPDVTDLKADGNIHWGKENIAQGENSWLWHGVNTTLPAQATKEALDASKDLRFNGEGGTLVLEQSVNQGAGKLQFSNDYQVKSATGVNSTWVGGGIEVDAGKTVLWQVNGLVGDVMHKIGQGTLQVNATGINGGGLNIGDGKVVLDQQADENGLKQAFSTVTLVSGRPVVVLGDSEQIATSNIRFGYRGGTLDINGTSLSFSEINHNDNGAILVNRNTENTGRIALYGNGFNFLGHIGEENSGKLNLSYTPTYGDYRATLSGGADLQELVVEGGELILSGQQTLHANNVLYSNDWSTQRYSTDRIDVQSGSALTVSDHAAVTAHTTVAGDATLNLYAHTLLSGSVTLSETDSLLNADITERNSTLGDLTSVITADITGDGQLIKKGDGVLQVDGDISTTGPTNLAAGTLALNGNVSSVVNTSGGTVLGGSGSLHTLNTANGSTIYPGTLLAAADDFATLRVNTLNASGTVNLVLNSAFDNGKTDKLRIEGSVTSEEPIMVNILAQDRWKDSDSNLNGAADNTEGVSVIQVGGQSGADRFKLAGNYVARGAWAYGLYAFAPGKSAESEREVTGTDGQYWDYRLQNILLSEGDNALPAVPDEKPETLPDDPGTADNMPDAAPDDAQDDHIPLPPPVEPAGDNPTRRAVLPQVPSYISLPSALFRAEEQRTALFKESALDAAREGHAGFFLSGYRGDEKYHSGSGFLEYGYNYKSRYKGWMMGANIAHWQDERQSLSLSGAWSKGDLTLTPSAADGVSQGHLRSNALNLMLSWHYDHYYLNLLSGYGWSKGDVSTDLRGKVASPSVKQIFAEAEGGKSFQFGDHRVRPYIGYRHQQMHIGRFTDVDNAQVSYQQQHRAAWTSGLAYDYTLPVITPGKLRLGSDISLTTRSSGRGSITAGDGQQSHVFHTGTGGNTLNIKTEARLDVNQNVAFTTQLRHQRKLQQEGANDWLVAGGINIHF